MNESFRIDEGHVFYYEDFISYVKWKVRTLEVDGWSKTMILEFREDESWHYYVGLILG